MLGHGGACTKGAQHPTWNQHKKEWERREGRNKGEEQEKEKEKGEEMEMGVKETGRRQMNLCNDWALRIPFSVMGSCLIYETETGHQYYRIDIYLLSLCCRKRHVGAKSKVGKRSSLNGWQSHPPLQPSRWGPGSQARAVWGSPWSTSHLCSVCKQPFCKDHLSCWALFREIRLQV